MAIKIRNFLLRSIPYALSIIGGAVLYLMTKDEIHDPSLAALVTNIAASLLSIPLVFLLYDYSNYWVNKKLKQRTRQKKSPTL